MVGIDLLPFVELGMGVTLHPDRGNSLKSQLSLHFNVFALCLHYGVVKGEKRHNKIQDDTATCTFLMPNLCFIIDTIYLYKNLYSLEKERMKENS